MRSCPCHAQQLLYLHGFASVQGYGWARFALFWCTEFRLGRHRHTVAAHLRSKMRVLSRTSSLTSTFSSAGRKGSLVLTVLTTVTCSTAHPAQAPDSVRCMQFACGHISMEVACTAHLLRNKLHHACGKPRIGVLSLAQTSLDAYHKLCSHPVKPGALILADYLHRVVLVFDTACLQNVSNAAKCSQSRCPVTAIRGVEDCLDDASRVSQIHEAETCMNSNDVLHENEH